MAFRGPKCTDPGGADPTAQENRVADRLGGKRVSGSGASEYSKADVRDVSLAGDEEGVEFLVECKQTVYASMPITWKWLLKISLEALAVQKEPALAIEIKGGEKDPNCDRDWVLLPARVLEKLVGKKVGTGGGGS